MRAEMSVARMEVMEAERVKAVSGGGAAARTLPLGGAGGRLGGWGGWEVAHAGGRLVPGQLPPGLQPPSRALPGLLVLQVPCFARQRRLVYSLSPAPLPPWHPPPRRLQALEVENEDLRVRVASTQAQAHAAMSVSRRPACSRGRCCTALHCSAPRAPAHPLPRTPGVQGRVRCLPPPGGHVLAQGLAASIAALYFTGRGGGL
jgi:hypothetical protein